MNRKYYLYLFFIPLSFLLAWALHVYSLVYRPIFEFDAGLIPEMVMIEEAPAAFINANSIPGLPITISHEALNSLVWKKGDYTLSFFHQGSLPVQEQFIIARRIENFEINWELKEYSLSLSIDLAAVDEESPVQIHLDGMPLGAELSLLKYGEHKLVLAGSKIKTEEHVFFMNGDYSLYIKADPAASLLKHTKTLEVGKQPKGIAFSRDGQFMFVSLLAEPGIDVFDASDFSFIKRIQPDDGRYLHGGFVELAEHPSESIMLASKMETGTVHFIPLDGNLEMDGSMSTRGSWSKVIAFDREGKLFAVSNWLSLDVTVFSWEDRSLVARVKIPGTPRGLAFYNDWLFVSNYDSGELHRINTKSWQLEDSFNPGKNGALRHLLVSARNGILFASDMHKAAIFCFDLDSVELIKKIPVDFNPNTIALSPDESMLFVSCRGPNNPLSYLLRSPRSGELCIIDCRSLELIDRRVLGNQPTGLAVHPSGQFLAVSNFLDNNIEIYWIDAPTN